MQRQKSFLDKTPTLYLVPTPIGNFDDMTYRAVVVLKNVDLIYAEDTRVTKVLLSHFSINTPLLSYHIFNENEIVIDIINKLKEGKSIALVSDAGMPCISDPGFLISNKAVEEGINVISLPGANAALTALIASGLPSEKFFFYGFLDHKATQKEKQLIEIQDYKETLIFYEAPHRIKETLEVLYKVYGNRKVVIARELTKKYEEYIRGYLEDILNASLELKGEIVLIVSGAEVSRLQSQLLSKSIQEHYDFYINEGISNKDAMKKVAKDRNISKSEVYKELLD